MVPLILTTLIIIVLTSTYLTTKNNHKHTRKLHIATISLAAPLTIYLAATSGPTIPIIWLTWNTARSWYNLLWCPQT